METWWVNAQDRNINVDGNTEQTLPGVFQFHLLPLKFRNNRKVQLKVPV